MSNVSSCAASPENRTEILTERPMQPTALEVHAAIGRISISFASLEHQVRKILTKMAFRGEWAIAGALIEDNSLAKNLIALRQLARRLDRLEPRIERFIKHVTPLRLRRNLFIHGKWTVNAKNLERGIVQVSDLRVKYKQEGRDKTWQLGTTQEIPFNDLRTMEVDVLSVLKEAIEITEKLSDEEEEM